MWRVLLVILLLAIVAGINYVVVDSLRWWGYFQTTYNHGHGSCRKLPETVRGSEDIVFVSDDIALISSGMRKSDNATEGKIFSFNFARPGEKLKELSIEADSNIKLGKPHGMSSWKDPDSGATYLYVINHLPGEEVVDKFEFDERSNSLTHQRRIGNESNFVALNDLVVVGDDKFYFTNYKRYCQFVEMILGVPLGSIGYYNGSSAKLVEQYLLVPNGIEVSADKKFLYVGMTGRKEIRIYSIHDNKFTFNNSVAVSTSVDNLFVHSSKDIWFAALPVLHKTADYLKNPAENTSPSQVMRVKMSSEWQADGVEEVYSNDGTEISGASSVVFFSNTKAILVGSAMSEAHYCAP